MMSTGMIHEYLHFTDVGYLKPSMFKNQFLRPLYIQLRSHRIFFVFYCSPAVGCGVCQTNASNGGLKGKNIETMFLCFYKYTVE